MTFLLTSELANELTSKLTCELTCELTSKQTYELISKLISKPTFKLTLEEPQKKFKNCKLTSFSYIYLTYLHVNCAKFSDSNSAVTVSS